MQEDINVVRSIYYTVRTDQYARIGHRIISVQNDILVFGGVSPNGDYNPTTIKVDCETMTLDFIHTKNTLKLQGFSIFSYQGVIYFWGGTAPGKEDARASYCQNKLLKFVDNQFSSEEQKGQVPAAREYHASCMASNKYLIIMGGNNGQSFFNDWHLLECSSMTWFQLSLNQEIPPFLDARIFWYGGRGFLLSGQTYDSEQDSLLTDNKLFEFRFKDFKQKKLDLEEINVSLNCQQKMPRGSPSAVFVPLQSPYLVLLGGSYVYQRNPMKITNEVECFNLETLQWFPISSAIKAAFAFEALYTNEKIYFVGGMTISGDIAQFVQYMELKVNFLEAKVCKVCREVYGLKQFNIGDRNVLSIKIEADSSPKYFFTSQIMGRMALYIGYPFSALGLLVDNSLNLSGTNIDIQFGLAGDLSSKKEQETKQLKEGSQPYNYISIIDNSYGFTQHEILECLNTFSLKTEKFTSDKRFEDQIEIRKEYGINLKLGALRIGQSCLFITKTEDRSKLYAYFSVNSYYSSAPFSVMTYIVSPEGPCSSEINRKIIKQNVRGKIPDNYEDISAPTILYLFDLKRLQMSVKVDEQGIKHVLYKQSLSKIYRDLQEYIQSLYLNPYKGRRIAVNGRQIKFRSYLQLLKRDEQRGELALIMEEDYPKEIFSCFNLYRINSQNYFLRNILCYHKNRLVFTINGIDSKYCGVVELSEAVRVDICKTKIENRSDELSFHRIIRSILSKYETKRIAKVGFKSLPTVYKDNNIGQQILKDNYQNVSRSPFNQR